MIAGWAALPLAIPPGYASPLYPAAGVALTSVLMGGRRLLPAVAIGAFCIGLLPDLLADRFSSVTLRLALALALGAALQALAGAELVKRHIHQPLTLSRPRDVAAFFVVNMVACLVGAAIATLGLWLTGSIKLAGVPLNAAIWWTGELLGVLISAPILLTLFGRPREAWAPRRRLVGLTLAVLTVLLALGIRQVGTWNTERMQTSFDREATGATLALAAQLREPLAALNALHGLFLASENVTPQEMRMASRHWLARGGLQAMAWSERSRNRDGSEAISVQYMEPLSSNGRVVGSNLLSNPALRPAVEEAGRSGDATASAGLPMTRLDGDGDGIGVVVYQALYNPRLADAAPRMEELQGLLSITVRMSDQLAALNGRIAPYLVLCLVDAVKGQPPQRLAGAVGCETQTSAPLQQAHAFNYGGRPWEVRVSAQPGAMPTLHGADVWLFALVGLFSTAIFGGFLLIVTGRSHQIETAVRERTAALQAQVHERETAESALRESEQRFRNILNHVPIGVIYSDLLGKVKQANPRFCELTGYSEPELLQMNLADYTHEDDKRDDAELTRQLVKGEIPMYRRNKRYLAKGGAIVWVQATVSLLRFADGEPRNIVGVVEDITEHLKLEEAEHAREAAEASNRAKSEFLSRMSHELRTPLNAMLGFAQLLELDPRNPLTPAQKPWVGQIQQAGWHLLEMINDVLDLSRIESGNLRLHVDTLNLPELLQATLGMVTGEAHKRHIVISQDLTPGTSSVLGDATRVKQILTNLLSNAVKYNVEGGQIHVASRLPGNDTVQIVVTDTGLGMTPGQLSELFQPFNRLGRERSAPQGTGIGLVISQRLAELMGGSLVADSEAGRGSAFTLTLPCAVMPDTVRSELDQVEPTPSDYHRRLVHYVEDNETNVEVMRGILAQRPQIEMQVSITGLDGLAAIRAQMPDLILLDMHLPDISGMELLRYLKADLRTSAVPVVVVSADALGEQIAQAFEAGCAHYQTKPVSVPELLAVLDDLLDSIPTRYA